MTDPYAFSPGYYDLFRAKDGERALPSAFFFADLTPPDAAVLEIGSGTGRITLAVAERAASVWCLERSATMRAVLLAKLAERPHLWDRVTVLAGAVPSFQLGTRFDYVCLAGVLEHVLEDDRLELFRGIADHLMPGGIAAMDMVLNQPAPDLPDEVVTDEVALGECRYTLSAQAEALGPDQSRLRMTYRTYHRDSLIATEVVERLHNMHRPDKVLADLAAVGLSPVGSGLAMASNDPGDPGAVVVRKDIGP